MQAKASFLFLFLLFLLVWFGLFIGFLIPKAREMKSRSQKSVPANMHACFLNVKKAYK